MPPRSGTSSATMHTGSPLGSSWMGSSPSRQSPVRNGNRTPLRHSLRRSMTLDKDSPSKQMVLEFSQLLIRSEQNFTNELDEACAKSAAEYQRRISIAASEHERVREGAELEVKRLALEQELEQKKREEAARREVEKQQRELEKIEEEKEKAKREEQERQRRAEAKKREEEAARQASEQQRQREEAEARLKAQRDQEEAARKSQLQQQEAAAAARKAQEQEAQKARLEAAKAPLPAAQPSPAPVPSTSTASGPAATAAGSADVENIHSRYLALHMRMKEFWKPFRKSCAQPGNPLKGPVGDLRRDIRKTTGQVTVRREDSKVVITKLRDILRRSRAAGGPTVDIRPFIISHPPPTLADESEAQYPAILLYAFICFEKFVVKQFDQEAANEEGRIIQELGAIAASLFMDKEFAWQGIPLTDLLLAKYHRVCPILFGVTGDLKSSEGRARLGWLPVSGGQISTNDYHQRMVGLAAGYAAFTLRHVATPALPISEYWRALASICNTPADKLYSGHFMVMKGLVKDSARKVLLFYGAQGRALLRQATIVMPRRAPPHASESATLVSVLPEVWKTLGISLE